MLSSWASVAAGRGKGKQSSANGTNNEKSSPSTSGSSSNKNSVSNLTVGLGNLAFDGPNNVPGIVPWASQDTGSESAVRGRGNGRRGRGRGWGNQSAAAWPPIRSSHQQARPTPTLGMDMTQLINDKSRPQLARGGVKSKGKKWTSFTLDAPRKPQLGPSATLHRFPELPAELRLKIWNFYTDDEERLIEIEHGINDSHYSMSTSHHYVQRVSRQSRIPPPILLINKETRTEFLKVYKKVRFDTRIQAGCEVYYNPDTDIVFFGDNTCITSIIYVFSKACRQNFDIPRVAIRATNKLTNACCDWDDDDDDYEIDLHRGVPGGCSVPQALYGLPFKDYKNDIVVPGCPGLKQVFFVQPSMFWPVKAGEINPSVGFRPAVGDGITAGQKQFKSDMTEMIERVESDVKIRGAARDEENKWTDDSKPTFSFVSLAPKVGADLRVYDTLVVKADKFKKLIRGQHRTMIDNASIENKVVVTWCKYDYDLQLEREIGLFGHQESIENVKTVIAERWFKINEIVEADEA